MLCSRHQDIDKLTRTTGQGLADGFTRERCNLYVVEVKSKNPNYIYSKRIWYVDPETNWIVWQETFDKLGRFWKCFELASADLTTELGQVKNMYVSHIQQDFQRNHSGMGFVNHKAISTKKIKPSLYSLGNLQKTY